MSSELRVDPAATVRALLAAAELAPSEPEVEAMIASYPGLRAAADGLQTDAISRFEPCFLPTEDLPPMDDRPSSDRPRGDAPPAAVVEDRTR